MAKKMIWPSAPNSGSENESILLTETTKSESATPHLAWLLFLSVLFLVAILANIHFQLPSIKFSENLCRRLKGCGREDSHLIDIFLAPADAPELVVDQSAEQRRRPPSDPIKCSHHSCFDLYRCGLISYNPYVKTGRTSGPSAEERIKVYIYPSYKFVKRKDRDKTEYEEMPSRPVSLEFTRMLMAIVSSRYFTNEPCEACLFIPNLDLLNLVGQSADQHLEPMLWSLPHFRAMNGSNHLLFVMIADHSRVGSNGLLHRAMIARGGSLDTDFRLNFDVAIPVYSILSRLYERKGETFQPLRFDSAAIMKLERTWTVVSVQQTFLHDEMQYVLTQLESFYSNRMVLLTPKGCSATHDKSGSWLPFLRRSSAAFELYNRTYVCNHERRIVQRYLDVLHHSEFCLILPSTSMASLPLLSEALMSGCIPAIVHDNFVFPFAEKIDWAGIAVRVRQHALNDLVQILDAVSPDRRRRLRLMGLNIWNRYFRTVENISLTVLDIINERVYPRQKNIHIVDEDGRFHELKPRSFEFFTKGFSYISPKSLTLVSDGFTAVVLTYNRPESLFRVVASVGRVASCRKILVIWNDPLQEPPGRHHWPTVSTPIQVIKMKENRLSNRFFPYGSIQTEAVFAIDDDITMLNVDEIEFAYQTWHEFPDRIVGFPSRLHFWNNLTHSWSYDSEWKNRISLILTGAAFYHHYYNYLYTHTLPASIRRWVDDHMNCEDIAMNFLVSNITGKAPIKVTPRKKFKCPECNNRSNSLSDDVLRHLKLRSECVDRFAAIYKMMPLKAVEFRSDPVLFRDNIPEKFKHFSGIGNL